jgi:signal transduction histidine kinase
MNQVFLNLLVNAAHAVRDRVGDTGEKGDIEIRTAVEGTNVHVTVRDTGTGIPEAVRARVFDPFFTTREVGRGTGQGLAIARSIVVDKHGGALWFDTECGAGTTFHVVLPLRRTAA